MQIIAELAMIIGQEVAKSIPYITKKAQPNEFITLSLVTFFIINETNNVAIAR